MRRFFVALFLAGLASGCANHQFDNPAAPTPTSDPTVPAKLNLDATPGTGDSAGTAAITATVRNAAGLPLSAVAVAFSVDSGTIPASATTNEKGAAIVTLNAPAGPARVTAKVGSLSIVSIVAIQPSPAPTTTPQPTPPTPPTPVVTVPLTVQLLVTPGLVGSATTFAMTSTAGIVSATWTFGDASSVITGTPSTTHVYTAPGSYTAGVTVTDTLGRTEAATTTLTIAAVPVIPPTPPPAPAITVKLGCVNGTSASAVTPTPTDCNVSATDQTGAIVTASITQVVWNWGDGAVQTVNGVLNQRQYLQSGVYTVFVTVTANGLTNTGSAIVTIP